MYNLRQEETDEIQKYKDNLQPVSGPKIEKKKELNNMDSFQIIDKNNNSNMDQWYKCFW